jgi:multicomponent Na+:H+ antiporter subunit F
VNIVALVMLAIGAAGFLFRLLHGPSLPDRVVGVDGLLSIVVIGIIAGAARSDNGGVTVETVLVAVFVGFVGTAALSRFIERRGD